MAPDGPSSCPRTGRGWGWEPSQGDWPSEHWLCGPSLAFSSDCPTWLWVGVKGSLKRKVQAGEPTRKAPGERNGPGLLPWPRESEMFSNTEEGTAEWAVTRGGVRALGP